MATNTFLDSATITALLQDGSGQSVAAAPPNSPSAGNVWWDTSVMPYARRVYIAGGWEDSGARFDPASGQLTLVQAGAGLSLNGPSLDLDISSLPAAP
jgi:hypothetical protein